MVIEEACYYCGEWFVKRGNQRYCCKECRELAEKQQWAQQREKEKIKKKKKAQGKPGLSIEGMVDVMLKLSEERGHIVQYGEVQRELLTGRLKLNGGVSDG